VPLPVAGRSAKGRPPGLHWVQNGTRSSGYEYGGHCVGVEVFAGLRFCRACSCWWLCGRYLEKIADAAPVVQFLLAVRCISACSGVLAAWARFERAGVYAVAGRVRPTANSPRWAPPAKPAGPSWPGQRGDQRVFCRASCADFTGDPRRGLVLRAHEDPQVEATKAEAAALRLKRLENLDVFLDLPLFTGLALTVNRVHR